MLYEMTPPKSENRDIHMPLSGDATTHAEHDAALAQLEVGWGDVEATELFAETIVGVDDGVRVGKGVAKDDVVGVSVGHVSEEHAAYSNGLFPAGTP